MYNQTLKGLVLLHAFGSLEDSRDVESWREMLETSSTLQELEVHGNLFGDIDVTGPISVMKSNSLVDWLVSSMFQLGNEI